MNRETIEKTNITSLVATAGAAAFVLWVASFTAQGDSLYAPTAVRPHAVSANLASTHNAASHDREASHGQG